ncbi:MAG TPA: glycosyltransferase family 2 protein [Bdellovibrionota bacterium]|nr:glycosyltransferase family 2 protein [Bdellovibrionota bacterium]
MRIDLSIIIPFFNEEGCVRELVHRVATVSRQLSLVFEVIAIEDGSRDRTYEKLVETSRDFEELRVLKLSRNFGQMAALSAGLDSAIGDAVLVMDGDLQDPPELIPKFVAAWREGANVVNGRRRSQPDKGLVRLGKWIFYVLMTKFSRAPFPNNVGTFCLIDRKTLDFIGAMPERQRFFAGLRAWVGGNVAWVEYDRSERSQGESRIGLPGLCRLAWMALTSFSSAPLRIASVVSMSVGLILFGVGLTAIIIRLSTNLAIPGWATFTTLIGITGFFQSVVLAILAEYVAVMFDEIKRRPLYVKQVEIRGGKPAETRVD